MRTAIEIIQNVRKFFNFGWVKERENKVKKNKSSCHLTATLITTRFGQEDAPPRDALPEMTVGCFWIPKVSRAAQIAWTTSTR